MSGFEAGWFVVNAGGSVVVKGERVAGEVDGGACRVDDDDDDDGDGAMNVVVVVVVVAVVAVALAASGGSAHMSLLVAVGYHASHSLSVYTYPPILFSVHTGHTQYGRSGS